MENNKFKNNFKNVNDAEKDENGMAVCHFKGARTIYLNEKVSLQIWKTKNDMFQPIYELYYSLSPALGRDLIKSARRLVTINKTAAEYGVIFIEDE